MQNEEQFASLTDAVRVAVAAALRGIFTAMPVSLTKDSDGHTAAARSNILGLVRQDDGTTKQAPMPPFDTLPVHFAGGGRMVTTHPVKSGDDGIWLGLSRAIDSWFQSGGQQAPIDARTHHLSDGVFLNGLRADPKKLKNVAPDSHQVRSTDGKMTSEVHPDNGTTTRAVDPSDSSDDPFNSAATYTESKTHPTDGKSWRRKTPTKDHTVGLTDGGFAAVVTDLATGLSAGLSLRPPTAGGGSGLTMPPGAAAESIGPLGGDLAGTMPNPTVKGATGLPVYANNAAARVAGLAVGDLYANTTISGTERVVCVAF